MQSSLRPRNYGAVRPGCFRLAQGMTIEERDSAISRRIARALQANVPRKKEGAGKAGCPMHPQPRVQNKKAHDRSHHRFTGITRPSLRDGFNGLFSCSPR